MRKEHLKHGFVPLGFELVNLHRTIILAIFCSSIQSPIKVQLIGSQSSLKAFVILLIMFAEPLPGFWRSVLWRSQTASTEVL